jgi:cytochrome c oxidase subunit 2
MSTRAVGRRLMLRTAAAAGMLAVVGPMAVRAQPKPRIIPVVARKFTYEPAEITLKLNEPVVFRLTTADVVMGFSVPDFKVRATIIPGQTVDLAMTPVRTGEFAFLCDVFCGSGHENMEGTLRVVAG